MFFLIFLSCLFYTVKFVTMFNKNGLGFAEKNGFVGPKVRDEGMLDARCGR